MNWTTNNEAAPDITIYEGEECIATVWATTDTESKADLIAASPKMQVAIIELIKQFGGVSAVTPNQKEAIRQAKEIIWIDLRLNALL